MFVTLLILTPLPFGRSHRSSHLGFGRHVDNHEIQYILSSLVNTCVFLVIRSSWTTHLLQQLLDRHLWCGNGKPQRTTAKPQPATHFHTSSSSSVTSKMPLRVHSASAIRICMSLFLRVSLLFGTCALLRLHPLSASGSTAHSLPAPVVAFSSVQKRS